MTIKGRLRPYRGKYCRRSVANRVNDFLMTLPTPDDTELQKEAEEFKRIITERRKMQDPEFTKLSAEVSMLNNMEGDVSTMCEVMELSNKRAIMDMLFELVSEQSLMPDVAAKKLKMSVDELFSKMTQVGYKLPAKSNLTFLRD